MRKSQNTVFALTLLLAAAPVVASNVTMTLSQSCEFDGAELYLQLESGLEVPVSEDLSVSVPANNIIVGVFVSEAACEQPTESSRETCVGLTSGPPTAQQGRNQNSCSWVCDYRGELGQSCMTKCEAKASCDDVASVFSAFCVEVNRTIVQSVPTPTSAGGTVSVQCRPTPEE